MPISLEQIESPSSYTTKEGYYSIKPMTPLYYLSDLLIKLNLTYKQTKYYWQVGEIQQVQGWILHLSVIMPQLVSLAEKVLPVLKAEGVPFKIAQNFDIAQNLLNGNFGPKRLAKILTIYPSNDQVAASVASSLITITKDFKGPRILSDFCLKNIVHTRYGSFSPIIVNDSQGNETSYIYNSKGELIPDLCSIPFTFPFDTPWPFSQITKPITNKSSKLVHAKYYPISIIRESFRGNIVKAIYFKNVFNIKACVLKQGRQSMCTDDSGRDVADRLKWQYKVCKDLIDVVPIPKIFDYFIENGDTYLAMEYIKGKNITSWIDDAFENCCWFDLASTVKINILDIICQVIEIVLRLHQHGYVHRDITPGNFIISKRRKVIPIDLELNWSFQFKEPTPPFLLGTPGYMSPQQAAAETPTTSDDVYSLGALILSSCTHLSASSIPLSNPIQVKASMQFFTRETELSELVSNCLQNVPSKRPDISTLKNTLRSSIATYKKKETSRQTLETELVPVDQLMATVQAGINGLANPDLITPSGHWISNPTSITEQTVLDHGENLSYVGWHTGVAGPIWLLSLAKSAGFDTEICKSNYLTSKEYIDTCFFTEHSEPDSSLFYGGAGIALALVEGVKSGLLSTETASLSKIRKCFYPTNDIILSYGISGQGVSLLQMMAASELSSFAEPLLNSYLEKILDLQQANGSWILKPRGNNSIQIGMANGVSGIIWFLLSYLRHNLDREIAERTLSALQWLVSDTANNRFWRLTRSNKIASKWFSFRPIGDVALIMTRAYEVFGDIQYKAIASNILSTMPTNPIHHDFSLNSGLARIGELHLEAYRVFNNEEYLKTSSWITNIFLHTFIPKNEHEGSWYLGNDVKITADLFDGTTGILHFLLRYLNPNKIQHSIY